MIVGRDQVEQNHRHNHRRGEATQHTHNNTHRHTTQHKTQHRHSHQHQHNKTQNKNTQHTQHKLAQNRLAKNGFHNWPAKHNGQKWKILGPPTGRDRIWPNLIWPSLWGPKGWGPKGWGPEGWEATIFALFVSIVCLLVVFWWCLKRQGAQMCTFGVLWLLCEAPAAPKLLGFHTTARNPKRAHLSVPALQTPPKFNEKTPRERQKDQKWRERKKSEIFGRSEGGRSGKEQLRSLALKCSLDGHTQPTPNVGWQHGEELNRRFSPFRSTSWPNSNLRTVPKLPGWDCRKHCTGLFQILNRLGWTFLGPTRLSFAPPGLCP